METRDYVFIISCHQQWLLLVESDHHWLPGEADIRPLAQNPDDAYGRNTILVRLVRYRFHTGCHA